MRSVLASLILARSAAGGELEATLTVSYRLVHDAVVNACRFDWLVGGLLKACFGSVGALRVLLVVLALNVGRASVASASACARLTLLYCVACCQLVTYAPVSKTKLVLLSQIYGALNCSVACREKLNLLRKLLSLKTSCAPSRGWSRCRQVSVLLASIAAGIAADRNLSVRHVV